MVLQCLLFIVDRHYCTSLPISYGCFSSVITIAHFIENSVKYHSQCFT